jgi:hypothetical protein
MRTVSLIIIGITIFSCTKQAAQNVATFAVSNGTATTIQFSGYTWNVKNGLNIGPGPNNWSQDNVWVDGNGFLHLKISKDSVTGKWYCAEVSTQQTFGFGKWQFWVVGRIDKMDRNVVLGLFNYSGNDGFDEMDIEWARWGNANYPNLNYTVWPAKTGFNNFSYAREIALSGKNTTQRFTRTSNIVTFQSLKGFRNNNTNQFATATCTDPPNSVSTLAMPAFINLWLFQGHAPANGKEVEIIIHNFSYTP